MKAIKMKDNIGKFSSVSRVSSVYGRIIRLVRMAPFLSVLQKKYSIASLLIVYDFGPVCTIKLGAKILVHNRALPSVSAHCT